MSETLGFEGDIDVRFLITFEYILFSCPDNIKTLFPMHSIGISFLFPSEIILHIKSRPKTYIFIIFHWYRCWFQVRNSHFFRHKNRI